MDGIHIALGFEDTYSMILDNLLDLELALLRISATEMVRYSFDDADFFDQKRGLNRHLTNLLSTTRQYLDMTNRHVSPVLPDGAALFRTLTGDAFDASLAYRAMDTLRNYVQHRDLGVHTMTISGSWIGDLGSASRSLRYTTSVYLDLDHLENDGGFAEKGRRIFQELRNEPSKPDVTRLVRTFIGGLAGIHAALRSALEGNLVVWRAEVRDAIQEFGTQFPGESTLGLAVATVRPGMFRDAHYDVFEGPVERLSRLQRINSCPTNLGRTYVSSEFIAEPWH